MSTIVVSETWRIYRVFLMLLIGYF